MTNEENAAQEIYVVLMVNDGDFYTGAQRLFDEVFTTKEAADAYSARQQEGFEAEAEELDEDGEPRGDDEDFVYYYSEVIVVTPRKE